jgi:hypothetical protein
MYQILKEAVKKKNYLISDLFRGGLRQPVLVLPYPNYGQVLGMEQPSDHIDLASFTLFRLGMIMITDLMSFFKAFPNQSLFQTYPKCVS